MLGITPLYPEELVKLIKQARANLDAMEALLPASVLFPAEIEQPSMTTEEVVQNAVDKGSYCPVRFNDGHNAVPLTEHGAMIPDLDRIKEVIPKMGDWAYMVSRLHEYTLLLQEELRIRHTRVKYLELERTTLRTGLEFYAKQASYSPSWTADSLFHVMEDKGRTARNALDN